MGKGVVKCQQEHATTKGSCNQERTRFAARWLGGFAGIPPVDVLLHAEGPVRSANSHNAIGCRALDAVVAGLVDLTHAAAATNNLGFPTQVVVWVVAKVARPVASLCCLGGVVVLIIIHR